MTTMAQPENAEPGQKRTSAATGLGYASSDVAGQLIFAFVSFYLLYFYTDVYGLSAATAGTLLLVARCIDAVETPIWGLVFDRTRSRWGRHRPWFLWLCGPFAVSGILTFLTPDLGSTVKVWYAALTYILCSVLYTGINTPVTSILSSLTSDPRERVRLTCYRMFGSKLGVLIVNLSALKLVDGLGAGDDRRGFMLTMPLFAVASVALYLFAFRRLEEVVPGPSERIPLRGTFRALRGNWPWLIIFTSSLLFWIGFIARVSAAPYLFEYRLGRPDLIPLANAFDFLSLATVFVLPAWCRRSSKRTVWALGLLGLVMGQVVVWWGLRQEASTAVVMVGWAFGFLASGAALALPFSLLSDSVDYGEWKTGVRAAGLLTAVGAAFCLKAGAGLGGALPAWIMAATGYVPNLAQSTEAIAGIELAAVTLPALCFGLSIGPVLLYGPYEQLEPRIQAELRQRRLANPA